MELGCKMSRNIKKTLYILLVMSMAACIFSCGKKTKHNWVEPGGETTKESITPGVHPERGSISDAVPIYTAVIYVPLGMQEKEVVDINDKSRKTKKIIRDYKTVMYEMNELTAENIDMALKYYGVLGEDAEFYSLEEVDDDSAKNSAGPGATGNLTKKGIVSYVDFISSALDNSEKYAGKGLNTRDLIGKIDQADIEYCIVETFASNFNLTSCELRLVDDKGYVKKN